MATHAGKSTRRKPLREVSNNNTNSFGIYNNNKSCFKTKKLQPSQGIRKNNNDINTVIDRLLLIRSDFSSFVHQIDELVEVLKVGGKSSGKEIESFVHVLSEMQASFMPWVPKFQKALSDLSTRPEYPSEQSRISEAVPVVADIISNAVDSPEKSMCDSLVSPSPLVSWRAGCTAEGGRQLFLLTPLPHPKMLSSKRQGSSRRFEKYTSNTKAQQHPLFDITGDMEDRILENTRAIPSIASADTASQLPSLSDVNREMDILHVTDEVKSMPDKVSRNDIHINELTEKGELLSPVKSSQRDSSLLVMMTPCLKMSPPKSCVLLEPLSEYNCRDRNGAYKMTPFPVARHSYSMSEDSESSSSEAAAHLTMKYAGKVGDESPNWQISPPKTCVLMEPPVEKLSTIVADIGGNLDIVESTPMMTESKSILKKGKHPGENTLKKELWEKFEAASTHDFRFNPSTIQKTSQKGFLERLEEEGV